MLTLSAFARKGSGVAHVSLEDVKAFSRWAFGSLGISTWHISTIIGHIGYYRIIGSYRII